MLYRTIKGKDNIRLAIATPSELVTAWRTLFRQNPPAGPLDLAWLQNTIVVSTSLLRLDFEIMRQRGAAFEGETAK